ncbi:sulfite exporter TauE/SafE family protein [Bosea caraganae]|uniref:Probable membrane transporter protein n=1 Tax=Bosea caraganae TaxID=2763117 RepID=A0A370L9A8_9HYPH|nr:sulfite exporter TauE/SafE family protein [Bosea caraganae]RDJ26865.1 sulfite exporter TauE/SafE family protein [Bosea caraganae]RDJ30751.1 sulfite exporter TauE/SafE family protein [Bosea caraganae]
MLESILPAGVSPAIALLLIGVSFLTSAFTAAFGVGGGVAMLGALAGTVSPALIIAVHGLVQVGSNVGRTYVQRAHAVWPLVLRFSIGSLIGVLLGAAFVVALPERVLLGVLGGFILLMAWVPKPQIPGLAKGGIVIGGGISTFITMFVGATGPFVQALLLPLKLEKRQLIATHAACTTMQHLLKVFAFGALGFAYGDWLPLIAAMILSGFAGTMAGTKLLENLPERWFLATIKIVLTLVGLDLLRRAAGLWD